MRFPRLTFPLLAALAFTLMAIPIACVGTNQESVSPSAAIIRSGCGVDDRGSGGSSTNYGAQLARAYACVGGLLAPFRYWTPLPVDGGAPRGLGYGCFCGSGNTGLNSTPADATDKCCQQHDIDLHGICQGFSPVGQPKQGCNCYTSTPALGCMNGTITIPPNLDPCAQACADDIVRLATCSQTAYNNGGYDPNHRPAWCTNGPGPVNTPGYCAMGPVIAPSPGIPPFTPPPGSLGPYPQPRSCL